MGQVSKTHFTKGVIAILLVIIAMLGKANIGQQRELAQYKERERARQLDDELDGLRIPYEALLYSNLPWPRMAQPWFDAFKKYGIETITPYINVVGDIERDVQLTRPIACADASFEMYWYRNFLNTCYSIRCQLENQQGVVYEAVARQDPKTLACLRLHLSRAMKSPSMTMINDTCRLWLRLFEPTPELQKSLERLLAFPKLKKATPEGFVLEYGSETMTAVRIIEEYSLDIPYPEDIKTSPNYTASRGTADRELGIDANDAQTSD